MFELEGIDELIKNLESLSKNIDSVKSEAVRAGAAVIQKEARKRVPKRTGQLEKSISISKDHKTANGDVFVEVGPDIHRGFYGPMIEWGTLERKTRDRSKIAVGAGGYAKAERKSGRTSHTTGGIKAQPFFEPAYLSSKDEAMKAVADVLREAIRRV